ncbi:MAG: hypothetical protein M0Q95_06985 [Porticoccaceae bacterium]|jgi:hypothetical protein|nr:hypothetical protein [Porticoccaceae bacterium]
MQLKRILVDEYSGFSGDVVKRLAPGSTLIVDDRGAGDYGAEMQLLPWFCVIAVDVKSNDEITVTLAGGAPVDDKIRRWVRENDCNFAEQPQLSISITLHCGDQDKLLELAQLFQNIVVRGRRDAVPGHKYMCSRTAIALRRLAATLAKVWPPA